MRGKLLVALLVLAAAYTARTLYFAPALGAGYEVADFTAERADGSTFRMSSLTGQFVLLEFWGSWCGPCRRESPALNAFAERFAGKATLVSVAVEQDSARWRHALQRDGRRWPNQLIELVPSLRFFSGPITDLYGVNRVPMHFLIAPDGHIIGADISLERATTLLEAHARPD